ncbi:MAG TPA: acetolactate synthase large subunit [Rhodospirillales bacterium]|nr:acetolactate synthase large subunit [Rhodospirillales bacterium]
MNGAERLIATAVEEGVDICFANPGTTEMPLVLALDSVGGMRGVLCLHENVCTGAADGYARLAGRPALALLHLGPGLANGLANLHNARRARSPVVAVVGDHASWHLSADPPLAMDIEGAARPVSDWYREVASPDTLAADTRAALAAARSRRGGVATLVVPHDHQQAREVGPAPAVAPDPFPPLDPARIERTAARLREADSACLFLGGRALWGAGLAAAGRIAARLGAELLCETGFARLETGRDRPRVNRLPYFPEQAQEVFDRFDTVVLCGARPPVSFFGYGHLPSRYLSGHPGAVTLAGPEEDAVAALEGLAEALDAPPAAAAEGAAPPPEPRGSLDTERLAAAVVRHLPEGGVVVLTAVSSAAPFSRLAHTARPHTQIALTGGAIGEGMALAIGAACARPGVRILHLEADGSAAYLPQALWTQAREGLPVTTVVCANRAYRILRIELDRAGIERPGEQTGRLTDLRRPAIDWPEVARGFGVPGEAVDTAEELAAALERAAASDGPYLIEARLP